MIFLYKLFIYQVYLDVSKTTPYFQNSFQILVDVTDSCFAENKCKTLFNFNSLLVMSGRVQAINLTYGQIGHSHGLVDAGFGGISSKLRKLKQVTNYETFIGILENLKFDNIIHNSVIADDVQILGKVYNFSRWFKDMGIHDKLDNAGKIICPKQEIYGLLENVILIHLNHPF